MSPAGDFGAEIDCSPIGNKAFLVSKVKGVRLVVIESSFHGIPADHPMKFNNILSDFFCINRVLFSWTVIS